MRRKVAVFLSLSGIDAAMTFISWLSFGSWAFEANPYLPDHWEVVVLVNVAWLICGLLDDWVWYALLCIKIYAIVSHPLVWIFGIQTAATTGEIPCEVSVQVAIPVFILGIAKLYRLARKEVIHE